jgi:hypothetical protein
MSRSASERHRLLADARRETIDGMTVLHLSGTPYAIGLQHGALCRDDIAAFRRAAYNYLGGEVARILRLPGALARTIARPLLLWQARAYLRFIAPEHREEMRGLADGAGVSFLEAVLVNAIWELYLGTGCSEFAVRGRKSADGALLHGYNYDLLDPAQAFISPFLALMFYRPAEGAAFAQLNMVGCVGVNAGLSARGISVAWDNTLLRPGSTLLAGVPARCTPFVLALRALLQHADSIEAAVEIMRRHLPRPTADIIIVGEAGANRAAAIETGGDELVVREMHDDAVWNANSFVSDALAPHDRPGAGGAGLGETGNSQGRYTTYAELLRRLDSPLDVAGAVAVLRDPYPRERHGYRHPPERARTICRPITAFSLVMQPRAQRLWVGDTRVPAPLGRYIAFDLRSEAVLAEAPIPATGYFHALRGYEFFTTGQHQDALRELEQALVLDSASVPLRLMLAHVYRACGQSEAAQQQAALARAAGAQPGESVAFPSAIRPLIYLRVDDET